MATNLFGRGMDIERVNIVFNYDMPEDSDTYLHRVARAGRFGTKGMQLSKHERLSPIQKQPCASSLLKVCVKRGIYPSLTSFIWSCPYSL